MPFDTLRDTPSALPGDAPASAPSERAPERRAGQLRRRLLPWGLLAVGLAFVIVGILQGGALDVWHKATLICLECIGIG